MLSTCETWWGQSLDECKAMLFFFFKEKKKPGGCDAPLRMGAGVERVKRRGEDSLHVHVGARHRVVRLRGFQRCGIMLLEDNNKQKAPKGLSVQVCCQNIWVELRSESGCLP